MYQQPCSPSPCGPNSQCRQINNQAVCSCLPTFIGSPPSCRPECTISAECPLNEACNNHKCINPCIGTCGYGARCEVVNHNPICSCPAQYTGDPFTHCDPIGSSYNTICMHCFLKMIFTKHTNIFFLFQLPRPLNPLTLAYHRHVGLIQYVKLLENHHRARASQITPVHHQIVGHNASVTQSARATSHA